MADDFRIYHQATGLRGQSELTRPAGPDSHLIKRGQEKGHGNQRLARFKRGRSVGDIVRGTFLRLEATAPGTAWVDLEGEELLAVLPPDLAELSRRIFAGRGVGATPTGVSEADFPLQTGGVCYFVLEKLEPEPELRMLELNGSYMSDRPELHYERILHREQAKALWRSLAALPPAQLAARYAVTRAALDHILQASLWPLLRKSVSLAAQISAPSANQATAEIKPSQSSPRELYLSFLAVTPEALERHAELNLLRAALVGLLRPFGLQDLLFLPWLCPAASAVGLALLRERPNFMLQATLSDGQRLNIRGDSVRPNSFRQTLEAPGGADLLASLLALYPSAGSGFYRRT